MEENRFNSFTDLEVWKKARAFKKNVYMIINGFPAYERFELASQLRRSVRSVGANIAEGHGRFTYKDQYSFCVIARGSLSEAWNHVLDAFDCQYISEETLTELKGQVDEAGRLLNGYMAYLKSRQQPRND